MKEEHDYHVGCFLFFILALIISLFVVPIVSRNAGVSYESHVGTVRRIDIAAYKYDYDAIMLVRIDKDDTTIYHEIVFDDQEKAYNCAEIGDTVNVLIRNSHAGSEKTIEGCDDR